MAIQVNTTRLLSQKKIPFEIHQYSDEIHDAQEVARVVNKPVYQVYKTLVVLKNTPRAKAMLIMIAADRQLDLKLVAKAVKEKKVQMASHQQAENLTGLKVGGISALALLNKGFEIYIDKPAQNLSHILISAGQRGLNLEVPVEALVKLTQARWIEASLDSD